MHKINEGNAVTTMASNAPLKIPSSAHINNLALPVTQSVDHEGRGELRSKLGDLGEHHTMPRFTSSQSFAVSVSCFEIIGTRIIGPRYACTIFLSSSLLAGTSLPNSRRRLGG